MRRAGFTLVELVFVLAILAAMVALVAPALAKSSRARILGEEATRLLALTEFARDEAVSQGAAYAVYVNVADGTFGVEAVNPGTGVEVRKDFQLHEDVHFEPVESQRTKQNRVVVFTPEGTPDAGSVQAITLTDRGGDRRRVARVADGWGYAVQKVAAQ